MDTNDRVVSESVRPFQRHQTQIWAGLGAPDARVLLRHESRRGNQPRIEDGKTLVVQLTAIGDTRDDGQVELFFELNGQPRIITVPNRAAASTIKTRRKAEDGNDNHVAAPMPGLVSTVSIQPSQSVKAGHMLMTLEAMKMETVLYASRDGTVASILVGAGVQVDSQDLLIEMK